MSIDLSRPYCVTFQIHNYKALREGFHFPYDPVLMHAMTATMNDLVMAFGARLGHASQFAIVLLFDTTLFQVRSLTSVLTTYASYATVRFNHYLVDNLYSQNYMTQYSQTKINSLFQKQWVLFADVFQQVPLHQHATHTLVSCMIRVMNEFTQLLLPTVDCKTQTPDELLELLKPIFPFPDFVFYGVMAKRNTTGAFANYSVRITQPNMSRVYHELTWSDPQMGTPVDFAQLYHGPVLKRINTEAQGLAPVLENELGNQNNTASKADSGPSVSS